MLWETWKVAKAYRIRPSEHLGIRDEVAAWSLDRAVFLFGSSLEADLKAASDGAKTSQQAQHKQMAVMAKWMGREMKFRDPAGNASKTKTVEASVEASGPVSL